MYDKGLIDGCFDGFHYGHVNALFQSKQECKLLFAASHCDEEIFKAKGTMPIFKYNDRLRFLEHCRFIDKCYDHVPYNTSLSVINGFGCDIFFHGSDGIDKYPLKDLNDIGKLHVYNRTSGVSTSDMLLRIHNYKNHVKVINNVDLIYLKYLFDTIENTLDIKHHDKIVILKCSWDLLNVLHLDLLMNVKDKYPNHSIYIDLISDDMSYNIFNKYEMAITLLGLKYIDKVLIYQHIQEEDYEDVIIINTDMYKGIIDTSFNNDIVNIESFNLKFLNEFEIDNYKRKIKINETNTDISMYKNVLKIQFNNLLDIIKSKSVKKNEHIIFDIDEVCLCNLMYHGIDIKDFGHGLYNYDTGIIPLNEECKELFIYLHDKDISYSFITGRRDYIRDITIQNLSIVGLNKYTYLFTCPNDYVGSMVEFKEKCREKVTKDGYSIIYCIGDQISDMSGKYIGLPFLIYNPFYITN